MRKRLIIAVTFLGGIYFIIEFLLPERFPSGLGPDGAWRGFKFREYQEEILQGLQCVGNAAIGLGLINIFRVFGVAVLKRRKGWQYCLTLILAMAAMMTVMFWDWSQFLSNQAKIGPLGVQSDFQGRILDRVGRPAPNPQAAAGLRRKKDGELSRYLLDTRAAVSPPDIGVDDAVAQISGLADFLTGKAPAPAYFRLTDAPANPPQFRDKADLLKEPPAAPPEFVRPPDAKGPPKPPLHEPLLSPGAPERLADLRKRRDELAAKLTDSANAIKELGPKAPEGQEIGAAFAKQAEACRELAPQFAAFAQEVRAFADAELKAYVEPPEVDLAYRGGPEPPPPPPYGRFYIAARALKQSADVLTRYANVLERAAVTIPASRNDQKALAGWIEARLPDSGALRAEWRARSKADLERAVTAVEAALKARREKEDADLKAKPEKERAALRARLEQTRAFRDRMLGDLRSIPDIVPAFDKSIGELDAAEDACKAGAAGLKAAAEAANRALAAVEKEDPALRLHRVRRTEQELRYSSLDGEDRDALIPEALAELAGIAPEAERTQRVLKEIAAAAKTRTDALNETRTGIEKELNAQVRELRKTWSEKTSIELYRLRKAEDDKAREIAAVKLRADSVADARKIAEEAAAKVAPSPGVKTLSDLASALAKAQEAAAAQEAIEQARRALENERSAAIEDSAKTMERLAYKDDLKDVRPLMAAIDGTRALTGAENSAAMLRRAARDARKAEEALGEKKDLAKARALMGQVAQELGASREGIQDALNEGIERSAVKGCRKVLFDGLYVSLGAAMFSLLAFYIASAAYRAFRVKSAEAVLMMIAALLVMMGQIPFGSYLWDQFPQVRLWVLQVFSTPAFRGIALGSAVAFLAMAMRMWLSLETGAFYREEEAGAEEGK